MSLILSSSINLTGAVSAPTIIIQNGGGGIVSSSQQIQNYNVFAVTSSANTFYGNQTITGSIGVTGDLSGSSATFKVSSNRNLAIKYDTNITISGQNDSGAPENLRIYADTFKIFTSTSTAGLTERFNVGNTGNLGIKTTTQDTTLHVSGSDGIKIQAGGNADTPGLTIINHTNQYGWAKFGGGLQGNGRGYATISNWNGSSVAEHVRVSGDGYLRLAGTGIQFNGDTADANSLDDYEEGTFTPTIVYSTTNTPSYYGSGQLGRYTKVGRIVQVQIYLNWNENGSVGNISVSGLPFTSINSQPRATASILTFGFVALSSSMTGIVDNNSTNISLFIDDNSGNTPTAANTDADQDLYITVIYEVV